MIDQDLLSLLKKSTDSSFIKSITATPVKYTPIVTQIDASNKFITRYFVRQVNDVQFITEVDSKQYSVFKSVPRFLTVDLQWKIIGKKETQTLRSGVPLYGVADLNRNAVFDADLTFRVLHKYVTNYLEFWIAEE